MDTGSIVIVINRRSGFFKYNRKNSVQWAIPQNLTRNETGLRCGVLQEILPRKKSHEYQSMEKKNVYGRVSLERGHYFWAIQRLGYAVSLSQKMQPCYRSSGAVLWQHFVSISCLAQKLRASSRPSKRHLRHHQEYSCLTQKTSGRWPVCNACVDRSLTPKASSCSLPLGTSESFHSCTCGSRISGKH